MKTDVLVIGGGPAGLAAAIEADKQKAKVTIVERDRIGGILNQCIHSGFGLNYFGEELTGPEYAGRFIGRLPERIELIKGSVTKATAGKKVEILSESGFMEIEAKAVVISTGCRERPIGALNVGGMHPAGIYTAGCAQRLINIDGLSVGKKAVILGSGDIGLIMARRLTLDGAKVECVLEAMSVPGGLNRNISQCLSDYNIPLYLSTTVVKVLGKDRVEGVVTAKVDEKLNPIPGTERTIDCDTLILSIGLIPENDLFGFIKMDNRTKGPIVNTLCETSAEGFFACGNALHVHDLVDNVTVESELAGRSAAEYALGKYKREKEVPVTVDGNISLVVPQKAVPGKPAKLYFRVKRKIKSAVMTACDGNGNVIAKTKGFAFAPNETITLDIENVPETDSISVSVRGEE